MNQLKQIRKSRGMTQKTLATLCGIPNLYQEQLSELENGKRPPTEPEKAALSAVLGVPAAELFPEQRRAYR